MDKPKKKAAVGRGASGKVKVYLHHVTDAEAACLTDPGNACRLQEVRTQSGADVQVDPNPSSVPDRKTVIIKGDLRQIDDAVRLLNQMTGSQEDILQRAQEFWLKMVEAAFHDFASRAYFLPPVYFNRVPMSRQTIAGQEVLVLQNPSGQVGQSYKVAVNPSATVQSSIPQPTSVQDSDVRDDAAMQRIFLCLQEMSQQNSEVFVAMSQLQFGEYLGEPCYSAASAQVPLAASLPPSLPKNWDKGDFDVLLIHRKYGLVVCEVKAVGDNVIELGLSQQDMEKNIRKKLKQAIVQLDKAEAMLSHLVSDIASGLRITKTIAVPNITARQVEQAIAGDKQLTQDLCRCLGNPHTRDAAGAAGLCLSSDQLSDPKTPCDVTSHVLKELGHWWQQRVSDAGPDPHMTLDVYRTLIARFCGPATTVSVPCTCPPRVSVKTLGQAVWWTGECYTAVITLFPEQVHLLHTAPRRLFVTGPPGTGKTVVLLLKGEEWLRCGEDVYLVSTWLGGRASSLLMNHLLATYVSTQKSAGKPAGQLRLLHYDFSGGKDVEKALEELSEAARGDKLYVIADEAGPDSWYFEDFCAELLNRVPQLRLWAASCFARQAPADWMVELLARPLRSPPTVVREVEKDRMFTRRVVQQYSERGVRDHTEGPPVKELYHRRTGHSGQRPVDCITCGNEVASVLKQLDVNVRGNITGRALPDLQWRDVLVLVWGGVRPDSGIVTGMSQAGIPVRVMEDEDIEDMATARSDVVWVADGHLVQGLERKVIVCVLSGVDLNVRLYSMSRCTSQLVVVSPD